MPVPAFVTWRKPAARAAAAGSTSCVRLFLTAGSRRALWFMAGSLRNSRASGTIAPAMSVLRHLAARLQRLVDRIDPHRGRPLMLFVASPLAVWGRHEGTPRVFS